MGIVKKKFKIDGMHCNSCALTIDWDLEDIDGIKSSKTSYAKAECEVEFNEERIRPEVIVETIKKSGYTAYSSD